MNAPRTRVQRRPVHGVLLLDKPLELSSNDALQKVKWLLRAEKAGHTGTLDPLATGVLPLCFGAATKFCQLQLEAAKTYEAIVEMRIEPGFSFSRDTIASILTSGLLGEQYIGLDVGGDPKQLVDGERIAKTQSALVLETLLSQFLFGKAAEAGGPK